MKQILHNLIKLRLCMVLAVILCSAGRAWGETATLVSGSGTSGYVIPNSWTSSGTVEGGTYLKFDNGTITSPEFGPHNELSFSYSIATFGSGTNHPLTIRILNASTNAIIIEKTTATPTSSSYISTNSPISLGDVNVPFKIQLYGPTGKGIRLRNYSITGTPVGGTVTPTCEVPTFSPVGGTYSEVQTVTISCATEGATIYYTTDGSAPTTSSNVFNSALTIDETTTIKAIAAKQDYNNSAIATATYTINLPYSGEDYVRVSSLDYLTDGARVIIASRYNTTPTSYYAMTATTSGKPTGVAFTSTNSDNGEILPASIVNSEDTYYWTVGVTSNGYTFKNANNQTLGYSSSTNFSTGGDNTEWIIVRGTSKTSAMVSGYEGFFVTNKNNNARAVALNSSHNYGPYDTSNINNNTYNFYVDIFVQGATPAEDPSISADNVELTYDATSGNISYSVENPVTGGTMTAVSAESWLNVETPANGNIAITCGVNTESVARTATITLTYTYNTDETVTKTITVTQAGNPNIVYTSIPALFNAATSDASDVIVNFGGWVVSAVHNSNAYLTDNQGHGLIIYASEHGFQVNDVLTGTVNCKLQLFRGSAELTNLTSTTAGLTVTSNGIVTAQTIAISELGGVNTGALVAFEGLTYNGTQLVDDGNNAITPYNTLYSIETLEDGKSYNVKGIYLQYNSTKEILPRSAEDIEEAAIPQHNVYFSVNGEVSSSAEVAEGTAITFPEAPETIEGKTFVGWTTAAIDGETDNAPTFVTSATMGDADVTYYAVYANQEGEGSTTTVTDELTRATTGVTSGSTSYSDWSGKTATSDAVYAGNSAGGKDAIQLRSNNNNSGVVTTTSGGKAKKVTVSWNSETTSARTLNIYGSNTAYTAATDLYGDKAGTLLGTIVNGTSTELTITGDYAYIGIRSASGAMYLTSISITWENGTPVSYSGYCTTVTTPEQPITVTIGSVGYTTFVAPADVSFPEGVEAFIVTAISTNSIHMEPVTAVPSGTPVVVRAAEGTHNLSIATETDDVTDNKLRASDGNVTGDGTIYALGNKSAGVGFYPVKSGAKVPAGKAYLVVNNENIKEFFSFDFGGLVTEINNVNTDFDANAEIYNLAGQRVQKVQKGFYIVGGKKVLVK